MRLVRTQASHGDLPAVADTTDDHVLVAHGIGEEGLVEFGTAGDLHDRTDFDPGLIHRHEEVAEPGMAFGARLGAGDDEDPVGELGQRRPDLLPVHHPLPVDEVGAGLHVGEIGAGVGFGVALTPEFVTREDLRHEPLLLRLGAERHQGRAEQGDTHVGNASRRLGLDIGEVEDDLLGERALTAADRGGKSMPSQPPVASSFSHAIWTSAGCPRGR